MIHVPHSIIYNAYKYDIKQAAKNFALQHPGIPESFKSQIKYLDKSEYTIHWGKFVKNHKDIYDEFIKSTEDFFLQLLKVNAKFVPNIKILKVYIDEIIVNVRLPITNIQNEWNYKVSELFFYVNVFKLDINNRQLYISNKEGVKIRNPFKTTYVLDGLNTIFTSNSQCELFLDKVLKGYINSIDLITDTGQLVTKDGNTLHLSNDTLAEVYGYNPMFYYKKIQEICKYICIAKDLRRKKYG